MLTEGTKITQQMLEQALSDPNSTMGMEFEFYLVGAKKFMYDYMTKDSEVKDLGGGAHYVKKVKDLTWHDILHYFVPLGIAAADSDDNETIIYRRLRKATEVVAKVDPNDYSPDELWEMFTSKFGVHTMFPMLKIWVGDVLPSPYRFLLSDEHEEAFKGIAESGDIKEMLQYKGFNNVEIITAEVGYEHDDYDMELESQTRNTLYSLVAKYLSEALGERVVYSANEGRAMHASQNYSHWQVTQDGSLLSREEDEDVIGIEVISPVMQAKDGYQALNHMLEIMNNGILGLQVATTYETGLHINYGVKGKNIDVVKILLLVGDEHMVSKFDRLANVHAASIEQEIIKRTRAAAQEKTTTTLAPRDLVLGASQILKDIQADHKDFLRVIEVLNSLKPEGKRHSINFEKLPSGYVEYRSIGNKDYHKRKGDIMDTVNRMVGITYIATDEDAMRKEYLKKLYQLMQDAISHTLKPEKYADVPMASSLSQFKTETWNQA